MKSALYTVFVFLTLFVSSCTKEAGIGGKKTITGTVRYYNAAASSWDIAGGATVMICYGTTSQCTSYDQMIVTDANGVYHFDGLNTGEYFIAGEYFDANGFRYTTAGYAIKAEKKKETLTVDIELRQFYTSSQKR